MLNRRLIRVKALQAVYAYYQSEVKDKKSARSFLKKSILGVEDTFINILQFADDLFQFIKLKYNPADQHLDAKREKVLNFDLLSKNLCLELLINNSKTSSLFNKPSYNWVRDEDFLFLIYRQISESDWLKNTNLEAGENFETDKQFLLQLYKYLVETSEDFNIKMEEINIHWQDEKIPVLKSVEKLVKSCNEDGSSIDIPPLSKDLEDDLSYSEKLLDLSINNHVQCEELISKRAPEWDPERIARLDLYIMIMALTEFMEFPNIPVKVTINEYLELAKIYSTPQSSKFINGILDNLLNELKKENRIKKTGRGLVE